MSFIFFPLCCERGVWPQVCMLLRDLPQFYCYCFRASKHSVSLLCYLFCLFVSRGTMHIFLNMYLWTHFSLPPLLCGHIDIYICIMYVIMPVDVCIFCSCVEIPLCEHFGRAVFFFCPFHKPTHIFFASVLYICLYKYVQRIMCPLPLLCVRATFVKLKVAGTTCFFKKFCAPPPTQSGACCTWWKQDLVGLNVL